MIFRVITTQSQGSFHNTKNTGLNNDKNNLAANLNLDILEVQKDPKLGVQTGKYCQEVIKGGWVETIGRLAGLIQQTLKYSAVLQAFILLTTDCQYLHQKLLTEWFANVFLASSCYTTNPCKAKYRLSWSLSLVLM